MVAYVFINCSYYLRESILVHGIINLHEKFWGCKIKGCIF
jgi:hypothetical protein